MFCRTATPTRQHIRFCMHGASCVKYGCPYTHPPTRPKDCPEGNLCKHRDTCKLHHPRSNDEIMCPFGVRCKKPHCPFIHDVAKSPMRFRKPCMHGAFCVKFGCGYAHPPGRRQECEFGVLCSDESCTKLHPRPSTRAPPRFQVGQQVQAQYSLGGTWRLAKVLSVNASSLTLQFTGWGDASDVPFERIKTGQTQRKRAGSSDRSDAAPPAFAPPGFGSYISRGAAVGVPTAPSPKPVLRKAIRPPSPRSIWRAPAGSPTSPVRKSTSVQSDDMKRLDGLKQAAIREENFLLANELKEKMQKVKDLELEKATAVHEEDFLLAMEIKKQITQLITDVSPSSSDVQESKQEVDDQFNKKFGRFSLFELPVQYNSSAAV